MSARATLQTDRDPTTEPGPNVGTDTIPEAGDAEQITARCAGADA